MLSDLIRAVPVAALVGIAPGWFWAKLFLRTSTDVAERITYSVALSIALVPVVALIPAQLFGTGVTLAVAVVSPFLVFLGGLAAYLRLGPAKGLDEPIAPSPVPLGVPALLLLIAGFGLALGVAVGVVPNMRVLLTIALLVFFAGIVHLVESPREPTPQPRERPIEPRRPVVTLARRLLLPAVLVLALLRGYLGPVLHDWPYIRGLDHYSHAVMAELMMTKGEIEPYLIYPPAFHTMTAIICRLTGLLPLEAFAVMAPALLLLPALALYALGSRLWGWECGVVAAFFSVLLGGTYGYFDNAMYPNLVASQFLLVLAVGALGVLYASSASSVRAGLLVALLGSSVVLYHQVASMYLAVLLALISLGVLPLLLVYRRRNGLALLASLALLGLLSTLYAWDTYDLPRLIGSLMSSSEASSTGTAVKMAVGTQPPFPLGYLVGSTISQPVAWLGLLGTIIVMGGWRKGIGTPQALVQFTLVSWTVVLFIGSRTPMSGFPHRFGRDACVPLALLAAFAFVAILRSLQPQRRVVVVFVTSLAVLLAGTLLGVRTVESIKNASGPSVWMTITPEIATAGEWLREHNEGGNIMVSPHLNQVPSRMMLAMGGYSALQSFTAWQIDHPRDLPPTGPEPLRDVIWVINHPRGERTDRLLEEHDVRYVVLYKNMPDRSTKDYWKSFKASPDLFRMVFENEDVLIVAPRKA